MARKAIVGKAPRKQFAFSEESTRTTTIRDHDGNDVSLVWYLNEYDDEPPEQPPPFPFQVYITKGAASVLQNPGFPAAFACFIERLGGISDGDCCYRFEVYMKSFPNILACVAHQRDEISHRNRNGIAPALVSRWTIDGEGHGKRIIVIDQDDWAETGVVLVMFDPAVYEGTSSSFDRWRMAGEGDIDTVRASRCRAKTLLRERLAEWWFDAGFTWTQADLVRRNEGGFSPALYPAVDPMAHRDAEHEDVHELDGTGLPSPALEADSHEDDGIPRIIDTFDKAELFKRCEELKRFQSEIYSDSFGFPVTSVWDSKTSKLRPCFSITLYMGFDTLPIQPKALFSCLNKGLTAQEAWTLDVVSNMPSLDAAFEYHARSSVRRTPPRVLKTRQCMQMALQKIASFRLPIELLEYIEELLVPPEIPDYSARPCRPFKDMFLYLDATHLSTGPLLIYSNPDPFSFSRNLESAQAGFTEPDDISFAPWKLAAFEDDLLRIIFLRYWNRVADEIHTLWSLCALRSTDVDHATLPRISLNMIMPKTFVTARCALTAKPDGLRVQLNLHSDRPVTVHNSALFSYDLRAEALEIVDVETSRSLPPLPYKRMNGIYCYDSWAQTPDLGFPTEDRGLELGHDINLRTFYPGKPEEVPGDGPWTPMWQDLIRKKILLSGRRYALRLKAGVTVPRWTWGVVGAVEGPYDLPPMRVTMDEEPQFTYVDRGDMDIRLYIDQEEKEINV